MDRIEFTRSETDSLEDLVALLEGRVFHVARLEYLAAILSSGEIKSNHDKSLPTTFGYIQNGFFRSRGCVSLFDYRVGPTEKVRQHRKGCWPFQAASPDKGGVAVFILRNEAHEALVPWTQWRDEQAWGEQIVPYVEAGYPGSIPLELVERVFTLKLTEEPSSLAASLRQLR